jgi:excinuclease ABC subunit A
MAVPDVDDIDGVPPAVVLQQQRGDTLYILDEPSTGLRSSDVDRLIARFDALVEAGNTVIVVEHDMRIVAARDWMMDIGPSAGINTNPNP